MANVVSDPEDGILGNNTTELLASVSLNHFARPPSGRDGQLKTSVLQKKPVTKTAFSQVRESLLQERCAGGSVQCIQRDDEPRAYIV